LSAYENILYGTTYAGGSNGLGTIFKVDTDGRNFEKLVDFDGVNKGIGPFGSLTLSPDGNVLYGVTDGGGVNNHGVVYKVGIDGHNFKKLVDFDGADKGNLPLGKVVLSSDGMLYGSTNQGGTKNLGVIFRVSTDGSNFEKLIDFDGIGGSNKGNNPLGNLNLSGNVLYGVTRSGGSANEGLIFKINTDGSGYNILINFDADSLGGTPVDLTLSGNVLYGVTHKGGTSHQGIAYKVNTDGKAFTKLFNFGGTNGNEPLAGVVVLENNLYGMTPDGGIHDGGVVFKFTLPDITTGIRGTVNAKYQIYPNPVTAVLNIKNELNTISKVELISMYGQVVKSQINYSTEIIIPTSSLANGVYIVKVYDKTNKVSTSKILKQ